MRRSGVHARVYLWPYSASHAGATQARESPASDQRLRQRPAGDTLPGSPVAGPLRARTGVPGVRRRTVFVTGSPSKPWNQADTSVAPDCGVEWTVAELRKQLNEDVATSLGTPPKQLDVLVRLAHAVSSKSTSKTVTGQPSPKITRTGTGA